MKPIETTLRRLSMLYEFNRKLRTFTLDNAPREADQVMEPTVATGKKTEEVQG